MPVTLNNITFDCADVAAQAAFWSAALDRPVDEGGSEFMRSINMADPAQSPNWLFIKVPEGKTAKNRMHIDLTADDRDAEIDRLVALGAERMGEHDEFGLTWTVLHDPEGNEFCVA